MSDAWRASNHWVTRNVRGKRLLIPVGPRATQLDALFTLNETAAFVMDQATSGADEPAIARSLADTYDVPEDEALLDVRAILGELRQLGAVENIS